MSVDIDMGADEAARTVAVDLEELLATRLLVQGNSGSGKSHLLRRLLEGSAGLVQQIVIDPEGDFVTLADEYGHTAIEAADYSLVEIARFAGRVREHRVSVVLSLEGLELEAQMRCAAMFLSALFDAPREHWYPALVVVDEAQIFAPAVAGEVSDEARRSSLGAMTNLMCRGRKRGLAGVIATQRLAKLAKNVAAEASNFLMGRTFLDIDMARAADLLGMDRRQAEQIRDLARGHFLALGPAISRRPISVRIGEVRTAARSSSPKLVPLPSAGGEEVQSLLFAPAEEAPPPPPPPQRRPPPADEVIRSIARPAPAAGPAAPVLDPEQRELAVETALRDIAADPAASGQAASLLYQDFLLRCRMRGLADPGLDLSGFRRRLGMAQAGIFRDGEEGWADALAIGSELPDDMLGPYLLVARAARDGAPCPDDAAIAAAYGTSSTGRVRRLLAYIEERGIFAIRTDLSGKRSVAIPRLGWTTAPADAPADERALRPRRAARGG